MKNKIDTWRWATPALKTAIQAQVDAATTSTPKAFLEALQAANRATPQYHVPEFDANLTRLKNQYELEKAGGADSDDLLNNIITKTGMTSGTTLL